LSSSSSSYFSLRLRRARAAAAAGAAAAAAGGPERDGGRFEGEAMGGAFDRGLAEIARKVPLFEPATDGARCPKPSPSSRFFVDPPPKSYPSSFLTVRRPSALGSAKLQILLRGRERTLRRGCV